MENFDFDEWSTLARMAPDEFESRRSLAIERIITTSVNMRRLRGLQCRIDLERARARTPLKACLRLSTMMWDSFYDCRDHLVILAYGPARNAPFYTQPKREAKILPFVRPQVSRGH